MRTLLLPCAGRSSRYPGVRPKWMLTTPDGRLSVSLAAASVARGAVARQVIAIRSDHEAQFGGAEALRRAFGPNLEVLVLDHDTQGPADTVALMIERAEVTGPILIKDADSFFEPTDTSFDNFVAVADLRECLGMSRVGAKSFALLNEQGLITDIVEKQVASNYVSVGLYGFSDASMFMEQFSSIKEFSTDEIFVSHVIAEGLRRGKVFRPQFVSGLVDVGTLEEWKVFTSQRKTIFCDVDGVVFRNQSGYFPPFWGDSPSLLEENVNHLLNLQKQGAQIVFVTSRPESYRAITQSSLEAAGFRIHALVMACAHAPRILINDFADSNPYPSASAINIARNQPDLKRLLS